eukprot:4585012-Pleurochrysis_carterae.AAC.1
MSFVAIHQWFVATRGEGFEFGMRKKDFWDRKGRRRSRVKSLHARCRDASPVRLRPVGRLSALRSLRHLEIS